MIYKYLYIIILSLMGGNLYSQNIDSTKTITDSTKTPKDTIPRYHHKLHGSLKYFTNSNIDIINKNDFQALNYLSFNEIIQTKQASFLLSNASVGQFSNFSIYGGDPRDNYVLFNGRNVTDIDYGSINLEQIVPDYIENIEILKGSEAAIIGGVSGYVINVQEMIHNTSKPFTRFWFGEAGYETMGADAMISQNFSKNWNITFGLRSLNSLGKFYNAWSKSWNVRASLRYSPSDYTSITLTDYYTNQSLGLNGGNDKSTSVNIFDNLSANPIYFSSDERIFRHDITLTISSIMSKDTSNLVNFNIYYSQNDLLRSSGDDFYFNSKDSTNHLASDNYYFGSGINYAFNYDDVFKLKIGGDLQYNNIPASWEFDYFSGVSNSAYGTMALNLLNHINLHGGIRLFTKYGLFGLGYGAGMIYTISKNVSFDADISLLDRIPTPSEGLNLFNEKQYLLISGLHFKNVDYNYSFEMFFRRTDNNIILNETILDSLKVYNFVNQNAITQVGANLSMNSNFYDNFRLDTKIILNKNLTDDYNYYPLFNLKLDLNYTLNYSRNQIIGGLSLNCFTNFNAMNYNPMYRSFSLNNDGTGFMNNGFDGYLSVKIGRAIIKATFSNLLGQWQYNTAYYPIWGRNFRLSVAWAFID